MEHGSKPSECNLPLRIPLVSVTQTPDPSLGTVKTWGKDRRLRSIWRRANFLRFGAISCALSHHRSLAHRPAQDRQGGSDEGDPEKKNQDIITLTACMNDLGPTHPSWAVSKLIGLPDTNHRLLKYVCERKRQSA